ncbi:MAG: DUF3494 domain-containing protein [Rhodoferax sp.]|uniref:ice-binding family protein n=1 Tax=Rhodoferax sp. TaxID=50421 RepID=UPI0013FF278D|nr:ice-binding family protein [Rhodoferax sp.]NDP40041.1 DUF3494 domain-containing protein [Rhodoferax sp.]
MKKYESYARVLPWFMALVLSVLLAACGGGRDPILGSPTLGLGVVSVSVTPATTSIPLGGVQPMMATATYTDGSTRDVTASSNWASDTTSVATVVPTSGVATGVASGTSIISADFGGKSGSAVLTVTSATLLSMAVAPSTASIPVGSIQPLISTATYSDGSTRDVTAYSNWTSGTPTVATVLQTTGVVTGVAVGASAITANFGGKSSSTNLTVTAATLASIAVTPAIATVPVGLTQSFVAKGTYSDGSIVDISNTVAWTSASPLVATVLPTTGVATGVSAGSALITATAGGKTGSATLTVTAATVASIAVTPAPATVPVGLTQPFVANGTYSDGSIVDISKSVSWTSASPMVATVLSNTGVATGVSVGTALITATSAGKSGSATLTVTPATLASIAVTPAQASIDYGFTQPFVAQGTYSDGSIIDITKTVAWTSGNTPVATVMSNTGVATGVSAGSAVITATSGSLSGLATLTVLAKKGPDAVDLGSAANFVILAKSGISTTGTTAIVGDIGVSPIGSTAITGFSLIADPTNVFSTSLYVTGKVYAANYAVPTPTTMTTAISDMETAFTDAAGRATPDATELGAGNISGLTIAPGLYKWGTGVLVTSAGVTLSGGPNDVWIFQIGRDLTVNNSAIVTLSGGAQAKNIFWQVAGEATLGTAADFKGNLLSQTLISLNTGAVVTGRMLAQTEVTLNAARVTKP